MSMFSDINYAFRLLSKSPGFTVLTTLVMACGIGLSVYLFSFMNSMLYKEFPFEDGDSLMRISNTVNGEISSSMALHDIEEIREQLEGVSEFTRYRRMTVNVNGRDGARQFVAYNVEPSFHQLTRIVPAMGRDFVISDMSKGALDVAMINHDIWQNQFAGRADVLGQNIRIDGKEHEIIGVMPQGYYFPDYADLWLPLRDDAKLLPRGEGQRATVAYHLNDGFYEEDIDKQLQQIMARIEEQYPKSNTSVGAKTHTIQMSMGEGGQPVIYALHVAAILILILASINVGNLLLTRALERGKETAIRVALGAPRYRLVSQMLWESIIICTTGAFIGLLVLGWGLEVTAGVVGRFFLDGSPFWWSFGIDSYTLKLFFGFLFFTVIVTGLLPAWKNSGGDFNAVLRDGTRGALGKKAGRLNKLLVVSEIFLSITILILAAVFMLAAWKSANGVYGGDTEGMLRARIEMTAQKYQTPEQKAAFINRLQTELEQSALTGDVVIASALPSDFSEQIGLEIRQMEYVQDNNNSLPKVNNVIHSVNTLEALNIKLKAGRYLNTSDQGANKTSVVVTDSLATRFFPDGNAIGQQIRFASTKDTASPWLTIVGVVGHVAHSDQINDVNATMPSVYRPFSQEPRHYAIVAFRMKADRLQSIKEFRNILQKMDPDMAPYGLETYKEFVERRNGPMSFISNVFLMFGLAALVLAASGIYGVMSNTISQRIQEIGVKRALGASEGLIMKEFLKSGLWQLLMGAVPGLLIGGGIGFAMAGAIGGSQTDIVVIAVSITSILSLVVLLATLIPTRQALECEPATALHYE